MLSKEEQEMLDKLEAKKRYGADISAAMEKLKEIIATSRRTFEKDVDSALKRNTRKREFGEKILSLKEDVIVIEVAKEKISKDVIPFYRRETEVELAALKEMEQDPFEKLEAEIDVVKLRVATTKNLLIESDGGVRFRLNNEYRNIYSKDPKRILQKIETYITSSRRKVREERRKVENEAKAIQFFKDAYPDADEIMHEQKWKYLNNHRGSGYSFPVVNVTMGKLKFTFTYTVPQDDDGIKISLHEVNPNIKGKLFEKHGLDLVYKLSEILG